MGTDVRLKLKNLEIKGDLTMANLGRKWPLQQTDGAIEKDVDRLWPKVEKIQEAMKAKIAFHVGYSASSLEEAKSIVYDLETDIDGWVDELVNYGRKILLANILHESAGYLYLEDC